MTKSLSNIKGIIWDLDDTLYTVTDALKVSMRESMARAVVKMGYPISYDEALSETEKSQKLYRLSYKILVDRFDIPRRDLHIPFHAEMDHTVTEICPDLPNAFQAHHGKINHVLMTHASRDWAIRMLDRLGIADFFEPNAVMGLEDVDFQHKHESDYVTKRSLDIMGINPDQAAFAEDRDINLTIPHNMGLTTVLIDHPSQSSELPSHVDYKFKRAADFLSKIGTTT